MKLNSLGYISVVIPCISPMMTSIEVRTVAGLPGFLHLSLCLSLLPSLVPTRYLDLELPQLISSVSFLSPHHHVAQAFYLPTPTTSFSWVARSVGLAWADNGSSSAWRSLTSRFTHTSTILLQKLVRPVDRVLWALDYEIWGLNSCRGSEIK